jgi:hypothetical protein
VRLQIKKFENLKGPAIPTSPAEEWNRKQRNFANITIDESHNTLSYLTIDEFSIVIYR